MFTQLGLSNLWNDLKIKRFLSNQDIQIICDSYHERCMKIYMHKEGRYAYFSSKRTSDRIDSLFEVWIRKSNWQPAPVFKNDQEELFFDAREERGIMQVSRPVRHGVFETISVN